MKELVVIADSRGVGLQSELAGESGRHINALVHVSKGGTIER